MIEKTQFQIDCEKAIANLLSKRGLVLEERKEFETLPSWGSDAFILIEMRVKDYQIWIYDDQIDLKRGKQEIILERPDFDNVSEMIETFISRFDGLLSKDEN